jgi:hypothetical protein
MFVNPNEAKVIWKDRRSLFGSAAVRPGLPRDGGVADSPDDDR